MTLKDLVWATMRRRAKWLLLAACLPGGLAAQNTGPGFFSNSDPLFYPVFERTAAKAYPTKLAGQVGGTNLVLTGYSFRSPSPDLGAMSAVCVSGKAQGVAVLCTALAGRHERTREKLFVGQCSNGFLLRAKAIGPRELLRANKTPVSLYHYSQKSDSAFQVALTVDRRGVRNPKFPCGLIGDEKVSRPSDLDE